jgi:hypothetical protein
MTARRLRMPWTVRVASALYALPGLAFGLGTVGTLAYLARNGELPMTPFGWRLMGAPLVGTVRFGALGWVLALALVATSALDVIAAIWLRQGKPQGARLGLATTPLTLMLAVGAFYLALLHLYPTQHDFYTLAANRYREAMPSDNELPHATAERLFTAESLRNPNDEWLSSDRPPLQAGWELIT